MLKYLFLAGFLDDKKYFRCCKLLLSRATQTPSDITREIQLTTRKELIVFCVNYFSDLAFI